MAAGVIGSLSLSLSFSLSLSLSLSLPFGWIPATYRRG
jgi:hypothetical protein